MNIQELNSESYNQKILLKKSPKMDLIFDQSPYPHKTVRNPTDHRHIGMTTYYLINNPKKFDLEIDDLGAKPCIPYKSLLL